MHKWQKVTGEWTSEMLEKLTERVMEPEFVPDKVVIGGPSNSTIKHGHRATGDSDLKLYGGWRVVGEARVGRRSSASTT